MHGRRWAGLVGLLLLLVVGFGSQAHALSVTVSADADTLTNTILGSGITVIGSSYTGASSAAGTFTGGGASGIGIESGIILTSGDASLAPGPNDQDGATGDNGLGGLGYLDQLIPGYQTYDATVLELEFSLENSTDLYFNYVFASEEYNEYANTSFNDVFGFFLDGQNIALIPGTTTPVSINNVNGGNPEDGTPASNPEYYHNNDPSDLQPPPFDIQYDGFTHVFTATATGLASGSHTIELAIADAGDTVLDSAVFIQAWSFSTTVTPPSVPEPTGALLLAAGLAGLAGLGRGRRQR